MKMVMIAIVGLVIFGASAAGSWFVKNEILAPPPEEEETSLTDITADPEETEDPEEGNSELMPVAVRDEPMTVEELVRFSLRLKQQKKDLMSEKEEFQTRKIQQQLVLTDIKAEQDAITGLQTKLDKDLTVAENMINELNAVRDLVKKQEEDAKTALQELKDQQVEASGAYDSKDKKIASVMQGMSAEKAALILVEFANEGEMDFAAQLLAKFEDRQAAKILDSIPDMKVVNELILRYRRIKDAQPPK